MKIKNEKNMKQIIEFNKRCAELVCTYDSETKRYVFENEMYNLETLSFSKRHHEEQLCFHSDWNWIMEVTEKIEKLGFATKIDHDYCISNYGCDRCEIDTKDNALFFDDEEPIVFELTESKKESVINAINEFLIWYEQNK